MSQGAREGVRLGAAGVISCVAWCWFSLELARISGQRRAPPSGFGCGFRGAVCACGDFEGADERACLVTLSEDPSSPALCVSLCSLCGDRSGSGCGCCRACAHRGRLLSRSRRGVAKPRVCTDSISRAPASESATGVPEPTHMREAPRARSASRSESCACACSRWLRVMAAARTTPRVGWMPTARVIRVMVGA
jgi:hypothetical protein